MNLGDTVNLVVRTKSMMRPISWELKFWKQTLCLSRWQCRIWIQPYQWCNKCWINSLHTCMFSVKMVLIVIEAAVWWSPLDKSAISKGQSKLPKYVFSHMAGIACCDWKSRTSRIDPLVRRDRNLEVPYASQFFSFFLSFSLSDWSLETASPLYG